MISKKVSMILFTLLSILFSVYAAVLQNMHYVNPIVYGFFSYFLISLVLYFITTFRKQSFLTIAGTAVILSITCSATYFVAVATSGGEVSIFIVKRTSLIAGIIFYSSLFISIVVWIIFRKKNVDFFKLSKGRWLILLYIALVITFVAPISIAILMWSINFSYVLILFTIILIMTFHFFAWTPWR